MSYEEDMPFKMASVDIVDEYGNPLDNPKAMARKYYTCYNIN